MPLLPAIPIRHRAVTAEVRSLGVGAVRCQRKLAPDPLRWIQRRLLTRSAPDEEKMTKRSPLDFPVEFDRNVGGARRADIFPQFSPFKPPLPQPSPGDPEEDDEDEEKEGDEENPDEDPEEKPEE
ncbi:hypothetical protein KFL_000610300 [Klebsormidium nitens]|uniref:Uncharacterized protein n=1 Tax=Klebsormidium nitens TaxID=105231 RepID=A0A0U9I6S3_KLENI|nr:hypothetical protein KFL_000610300 [Klebsormidium nitens]|eukprot:GAQ80752.1 hypothetical protein KFL_000610300 [Klebsormidium nitens]